MMNTSGCVGENGAKGPLKSEKTHTPSSMRQKTRTNPSIQISSVLEIGFPNDLRSPPPIQEPGKIRSLGHEDSTETCE